MDQDERSRLEELLAKYRDVLDPAAAGTIGGFGRRGMSEVFPGKEAPYMRDIFTNRMSPGKSMVLGGSTGGYAHSDGEYYHMNPAQATTGGQSRESAMGLHRKALEGSGGKSIQWREPTIDPDDIGKMQRRVSGVLEQDSKKALRTKAHEIGHVQDAGATEGARGIVKEMLRKHQEATDVIERRMNRMGYVNPDITEHLSQGNDIRRMSIDDYVARERPRSITPEQAKSEMGKVKALMNETDRLLGKYHAENKTPAPNRPPQQYEPRQPGVGGITAPRRTAFKTKRYPVPGNPTGRPSGGILPSAVDIGGSIGRAASSMANPLDLESVYRGAFEPGGSMSLFPSTEYEELR